MLDWENGQGLGTHHLEEIPDNQGRCRRVRFPKHTDLCGRQLCHHDTLVWALGTRETSAAEEGAGGKETWGPSRLLKSQGVWLESVSTLDHNHDDIVHPFVKCFWENIPQKKSYRG